MDDITTKVIGGSLVACIIGVFSWVVKIFIGYGLRITALETKTALTTQEICSMKEDLTEVKTDIKELLRRVK